MSPKGTTTFPAPAPSKKRPADGPAPDNRLRWAGVLVAVVGVALLCLAAGDALAGVELGGGGENSLHGSGGGDRLAGFDGGDALYGRSGEDVLYGGAGDDELYGGAGEDGVLGGPGDDFIEAKDGAKDDVGCGPGLDSASVDSKDLVSADCESVFLG